jgi:hypothetical protein
MPSRSLVLVALVAASALAQNWQICSGGSGQYTQESGYPLPQRPGPGAYVQTSSYTLAIQTPLGGGNAWTLHGLWANGDGGQNPSCCTQYEGSETQKENAILSLMDTNLYQSMQTYWPSNGGHGSDPNAWLWAHEWEKHGTCNQPYQGSRFVDPNDYFRLALAQLQQHQYRCEAPYKQCDCSVSKSEGVLNCQLALNLDFQFVDAAALRAKRANHTTTNHTGRGN